MKDVTHVTHTHNVSRHIGNFFSTKKNTTNYRKLQRLCKSRKDEHNVPCNANKDVLINLAKTLLEHHTGEANASTYMLFLLWKQVDDRNVFHHS